MATLKAEKNAEWLIALFVVETQKDFSYNQLKSRLQRISGLDSKKTERLVHELADLKYLKHSAGKHQLTANARALLNIYKVDSDKKVSFMGQQISEDAWIALIQALRAYQRKLTGLHRDLTTHLSHQHSTPPRISALTEAISILLALPGIPEKVLQSNQVCEAIAICCREQLLALHQEKERLEVLVRDRQLLSDIEGQIQCLQGILERPMLSEHRSTPKPRLTDFVNVGVVEESCQKRPVDEKFGILTAPDQFTADFHETAEGAFARSRSFAVGFADIDKFKSVNSTYGETVVDRDILPTFMRALEAYCYRRAYAYRQGGDEYFILLHNATPAEARRFFGGLQEHLAATGYPENVKQNPTISIGVHVIDGINEVTVFQAKNLANQASTFSDHHPES